jgi:putative ATP-binding cassette transporter
VRAAQDRLAAFYQSLEEAPNSDLTLTRAEANALSTHGVELIVPTRGCDANSRRKISIVDISVTAGEKVIIQAPSGFGKSLLFLALSGNWAWGFGKVIVPKSAEWVPQRPYLPSGTLRDAIEYPAADSLTVSQIEEAFRRVGLSHLAGSLDSWNDWNGTLSGGELARLGLVRAMLRKPKWLFLDEPTAALDRSSALACMSWVYSTPGVTVVAISHQHDTFPASARVITLSADEHSGSTPPQDVIHQGRLLV